MIRRAAVVLAVLATAVLAGCNDRADAYPEYDKDCVEDAIDFRDDLASRDGSDAAGAATGSEAEWVRAQCEGR